MNARRALPLAAVAVGLAATLAPAGAAAPKTISKTYDMQLLPLPLPAQGTVTCLPADGMEGLNKHTETLTAPAKGLLLAQVSGFTGDWDISVFTASGKNIGVGSGTSTGGGAPAMNATDKIKLKIKAAGTYQIVMCNYAGTPQATGKYTFTY